MTTTLLILGGLLVVIIMALIYRVFTLVSIAKGNADKPATTSNKINAILFPLFFVVGFSAIFWYSGIAKDYFLPEAASVHGKELDLMFWVSMAIIGFAFIATHILLFFFPFQYQHDPNRRASYYHDNHKLELIWTFIPASVMTVLVIYGLIVWNNITEIPTENVTEVEIMGKQFNWHVRYAGKDNKLGRYDFRKIDATNAIGMDFADASCMDDFTPREIHLPKNGNVVLKIRARDVLHSVFMPHFRVKMDAVPGMQTRFAFVPDKSTKEMREMLSKDPIWQQIDPKTKEPRWKNFNYELACTEVCGGGHFAMRMVIVVDEPEEFKKWYAEQQPWADQNKDYVAGLNVQSPTAAANILPATK